MWRFLGGDYESRLFFEDCHRRNGKSFVLLLVAIEVALGKAPQAWPETGRIIRFAAPTGLDCEEVYHPMADLIFEDCPEDLLPRWTHARGRGHFLFPSTDARLFLFGIDGRNYRKGRGKKTHFAVVDEVGFCEPACKDGVAGYVDSVVLPQTFGVNGRVLLATTAPETPGHPAVSLKERCKAIPGAYVRQTLDENAHFFGPDIVKEYEREAGGRQSTTFRREYGCEWVIDETRAAVPEWSAHEAAIVREPEVPEWFFPLVALDVGFDDPTHVLYGCWDFRRAKLLIIDETFLRRARTDEIAAAVKAKEAALWPWSAREMERNEFGRFVVEPWRKERRQIFRYSDTDLRLIADLAGIHKLSFAPTAKDHKEAQVNELRMFTADERAEISPRCAYLVRSLATTIWNKQRTEWERTVDGHGDGVDSALYMLRNAPRHANPYPPKYAHLDPRTVFLPPDAEEETSQAARALGRIFGKTDP